MDVVIQPASPRDVSAIAAMRTAAAERLTRQYGPGHWSSVVSDASVGHALRTSTVLVALNGDAVVGSLRLATKKPWAIDPAYFTEVRRPLYLTDMAVHPDVQRQGVGRRLLDVAAITARDWPADALRLDAYDAAAGAGGFYAACGFREVGRVTYRKTPLIYYELIL